MNSSVSSCTHNDIRDFDGSSYCLACGEAIFDEASKSSPSQTPASSSKYRYKRLNYERGQEIRLVRLHPAMNQYERLTCDIFHVNIADKPVYEALSYTWATEDGDSSLSESIRDRVSGTDIAITKNCEAALRYLRLKGSNRVFWIDAIAINQNDDSERSHQVNFMSMIYSTASQVLMFLGHESADANRVLEYLKGAPPSNVWEHISNVEQDVRLFLRRHYFSRVWALQEIALAKLVTLVVGNLTLPWTTTTIDLVRKLRTAIRTVTLTPSLLHWQPGSELGRDLLDVLHRSRSCSATDPRDKVYAVLGLVQHDVAKNFSVDYSMTPGQVFTRISLAVGLGLSTAGWRSVMRSDHAALLEIAPGASQSSDSRACDEDLLGLFMSYKQDRNFHNAVYKFSDDKNLVQPTEDDWHSCKVLRTRAHYLDTIVATGTKYLAVSHFGALPISTIRCVDCGDHIKSNIWDAGTEVDLSRCREKKQSLLETLKATRGEGQDPIDNQDLYQTVLSIGFRTIGFPRADDSIWAIGGVDVPIVLRKIEDHYILVGTCHLYQATKYAPCGCCGADAKPWLMETQIIDIW
ncbi:heterokaryon incompatibility protein-domain-containing protein [Paraphoma chrysanthemicola]|uniref:Heterokaryon incompatibility protein-domain-containing protein n=1 Tax=Paraphoma chrysanthemicola TaxID=798071 RepID=A0A8K0QXF3_9PLEO|nr:heterokaryon incompatibility protein-domain-containing protein [Paraphoma chrysanthemicola]